MIFDYYASLAEQTSCPRKVNKCGLASGFVNGCKKRRPPLLHEVRIRVERPQIAGGAEL